MYVLTPRRCRCSVPTRCITPRPQGIPQCVPEAEGTANGARPLSHSCGKCCNRAKIIRLRGRRTHKCGACHLQCAALTRRGQEQALPGGLPPGGLGGRASGGVAARGFLNFLYSCRPRAALPVVPVHPSDPRPHTTWASRRLVPPGGGSRLATSTPTRPMVTRCVRFTTVLLDD